MASVVTDRVVADAQLPPRFGIKNFANLNPPGFAMVNLSPQCRI
jgi:hypothetical protein